MRHLKAFLLVSWFKVKMMTLLRAAERLQFPLWKQLRKWTMFQFVFHRLEILKTSVTYLNQDSAPYSFQTDIVMQVALMCLTQAPAEVTPMVNNCIDGGFFSVSHQRLLLIGLKWLFHYLNNTREEITVNIEQWAVILSLVLCVHQFGFWNIQMHQNNLTQFMIKCIRQTWMNMENVALQTARPLFMGNLKDPFNPHCHLKWETFCFFFNQNFEIYTSWGDYS